MTKTSSSSMPALLLQEGSSASSDDVVTRVVVHPLVLLSVLDHHTRRQEGANRVIGTLLGRREGNEVEVTNCFAVPHAERGDEVAIGKDFNKQMLALHSRSNKKEVVVGWYATCLQQGGSTSSSSSGSGGGSAEQTRQQMPAQLIADTSSLIHEFYASECEEDPVHVVVDTSLQTDNLGIHAYKSTSISLGGEQLANLFHEIQISLESTESEKICVHEMIQQQDEYADNGGAPNNTTNGNKKDVPALVLSMESLLTMLETTSAYVDQVVEGKIAPDDSVGRQIADTLSSVPRIRPQVFDKLFDDSLQDLLMVTYLSNITRTQLVIAEKLNASLGSV